jgi:hypothetical protein
MISVKFRIRFHVLGVSESGVSFYLARYQPLVSRFESLSAISAKVICTIERHNVDRLHVICHHNSCIIIQTWVK